MKKILLLISFLAFTLTSLAQDFPFGSVSDQDLAMKNYKGDTSAHAVFLNEHGYSKIDVSSTDNIQLRYQYHARIKIFDKQGYDNGNVEIVIYNDGEDYEDVEDIKASTFYKDANGITQQIELEKNKIYRTKLDKHYSVLKFALPALKDGCIVEYSYTIVSPYIFNFHSWRFQADIPKMYSEYEVHIPAFWSYKVSLRGGLPLTTNKQEVERDCFSYHAAKAPCSFIIYGMKDVPAFIEEAYMTARKNFLSAMYFELDEYQSLETGAKTKVTKEWKDIDYQLKSFDSFGGQLKRKDLMKEKITPVIAGKTDELDKAKAIYTYIQKNFKWNEQDGSESVDGIRKAFDAHTGNCTDINLALAAALNAAGIRTEAILLSTREHGRINQLYPNIGDFNYVVAKANIGDNSYLLDATEQLLPFGMLPQRCLNDQGRVFSLDKPSYWMDMTATKQRETSTYSLDFTLEDNGKIKGTITNFSLGYKAYERRKEIKKFNSVDEYVENLDERLPRLKILKSNIENLDSLGKPVMESYEVEIDEFKNMNADRLSFNPCVLFRVVVNPFKLAERSYPVDWGMPSDDRYILKLHLPPHYVVENPLQDVAFSMPNQGGKFIRQYEAAEPDSFTFSYVMQFNKAIYGPEEYPYLKELYNKIIATEKSEVILKKK